MPAYLLGRYLDYGLGVFTGGLAYALHERNPRSQPPPGHTLRELIAWNLEERRRATELASAAADPQGQVEWEQIQREILSATSVAGENRADGSAARVGAGVGR